MFIRSFSQISAKDVGIAGGKGASLGEMTLRLCSGQARGNCPVPPGFVVLAPAFNRFLSETDLLQDIEAQLRQVKYSDVNSVEQVSETIRDLIHDAPMPEDLQREIMKAYRDLADLTPSCPPPCKGGGTKLMVAVRSSATAEDSSVASWAGELESYLNTSDKDLLENVKKCWSSLFTPRAIFYRKEKNLHKAHVSVAVVVQSMVQSEAAGISFTVHPVTKDRKQMIIEACWGLGEAIVSGAVTPDSYVLDKVNWEIIDFNVNSQDKMLVRAGKQGNKWVPVPAARKHKQILKNKEVVDLAKLCGKLEKHYKKPQDIEWAYADGKFFIVQSRPITTL